MKFPSLAYCEQNVTWHPYGNRNPSLYYVRFTFTWWVIKTLVANCFVVVDRNGEILLGSVFASDWRIFLTFVFLFALDSVWVGRSVGTRLALIRDGVKSASRMENISPWLWDTSLSRATLSGHFTLYSTRLSLWARIVWPDLLKIARSFLLACTAHQWKLEMATQRGSKHEMRIETEKREAWWHLRNLTRLGRQFSHREFRFDSVELEVSIANTPELNRAQGGKTRTATNILLIEGGEKKDVKKEYWRPNKCWKKKRPPKHEVKTDVVHFEREIFLSVKNFPEPSFFSFSVFSFARLSDFDVDLRIGQPKLEENSDFLLPCAVSSRHEF